MKENQTGKNLIIAFIAFFGGALLLYGVMYFFPEPFMKTVTEEQIKEIKNVTVTDTGLADAVEKVYDAVVVVKTYVNKQLYATGTGFVYKIDDDTAYILTNNHVIEKGNSIMVEFTNGALEEVEVNGKDLYSDIAVLSLDADKIDKVASLGSSEDARIGDTVFTVGAPVSAATYSGTVTRGILSGKNRLVGVSLSNSNTSDMMMSVLQTDAAINSGNSGGPMMNANGEVIGITSLKLASTGVEGMGFAIPIETAIHFANHLEKGEAIDRPFLGISMRSLAEAQYYHSELRNVELEEGVYIESVEAGSAAEKAGIKGGDIIVEIDGKKVDSIAYVRYLLYNHSVGETMKAKIYHDGDTIDVDIVLSPKSS